MVDITISDHEHYNKLIVEVADPRAAVAVLENALGTAKA
jgi:hypothetical protein